MDRLLFARLHACAQIVHPLVAVAFQLANLLPGQMVDVGQILDVAAGHKQLGLLDAKPLDVHGPAADKVLHRAHELLRAGGVDAVGGGLPRRAHERLAADRAGRGHGPLPLAAVARVQHRAQHLRDHLAGALDHHPVADADVQVADVVLVVQGGALDSDAAHLHRRQHRVGGDRAGAPHIDDDVEERGDCLLARVFVGQRPARVFAGKAQQLLQSQAVHLDHAAVHLVGQVVAAAAKGVHVGGQRVELLIGEGAHVGTDGQPQFAQIGQRLAVAGKLRPALHDERLVGPQLERPRRGDGRVELAQASRGKVPRVGVGALALFGLPFVETEKVALLHIAFPAHHQPGWRRRRRVRRHLQRQHAHRAQIRRDVLAKVAVAPRRAQHEAPRFVVKHHGQPVELRFDDIAQLAVAVGRQEALEPLPPGRKFVGAKGVGQAEHRRRVAHLLELLGDETAHAYRGAVVAAQVRVRGLQFHQFAPERVELGVGDLRVVKDVVAVLVIADRLAQPLRARGQVFGRLVCFHTALPCW